MLLFGSHGVTHPAWERRLPCLVGSVEGQRALADLESAAQPLDGVGLQWQPCTANPLHVFIMIAM